MKKNYITIWAGDYFRDVWRDYCDACGVAYETTHITIYFNDEDVETGE